MIHLRRARVRRASVVVRVSACIVDGSVEDDALLEWVQSAVARYHEARAGHVGISAGARIKLPEVSLYGEAQAEDRDE